MRSTALVLAAVVLTIVIAQILMLVVAVVISPGFQSYLAGGSSAASLNQLVSSATQKYLALTQILAIVVALPWLLLLRGKKLFTHDIAGVNQKVRPLTLFKVLVLMFGVACATNIITVSLAPLLERIGFTLSGAYEDGFSALLADPWGIAYAMLLGPIMEEIIFRGAILNRLARHGSNFAIVMSALMFGAYHMILIQGFNAFFLGVLLAYVALRYSIKWSMLLHVLYNSVLVGLSLLDVIGVNITAFMGLLLLACMIASIVLLSVKHRVVSAIRWMGFPQTLRPFRKAFTSPAFLVVLAALLAVGVLTSVTPGSL